jgi:hypothetical protein
MLMANSNSSLASLSSADLLTATRILVAKSRGVEADLLVHLGKIDERKLYLERAFPSMFAFCVGELGFSEDAAYSRILVARAGRRLPAVIEALRSGQVHLVGLRLLVPHLTAENHGEILAQATGKSKREIEELVARLSPQPPVPSTIRKLPDRAALAPVAPTQSALFPNAPAPPPNALPAPLPNALTALPTPPPQQDQHRAVVAPLAEETFKVQFTANRAFRDKLREAQDLLRHRVPDGDIASILGTALDLLIDDVKKERFAAGRKERQPPKGEAGDATSRHIPDAIKRKVYERDGGRCTFADEHGRRCAETGALEFDHVDGFARTQRHELDRIRLLCRAHNQYAAEKTYGRAFMAQARVRGEIILSPAAGQARVIAAAMDPSRTSPSSTSTSL